MNCKLYNEILSRQDPEQAVNLSRFFKTGKGQYGEGDKFLGIKVPVTREVVRQCWKETTFDDLEACISSEYHEIRLAALLTLVQIFKQVKKDKALQKRCVDFYLAHTEFINNWDLVDLSCYELLGTWLLDKDRTLLYDLARKGREVELAAKPVHIDEIELTAFDAEKMQMSIRVTCGKGTYIRSLARDIGYALGSGAFLTALCRTRVGNVRLEDCLTFDEFPAWMEAQLKE